MTIFFDIGGTKMRFAAYRGGEHFETPVIVETPKDGSLGAKKLLTVINEMRRDEHVDYVIGGVAGILDRTKKIILKSPHLPGWNGFSFMRELSELGTEITIENDSALVGLGEATRGAGKGHSIVVYVTVSTGVGGARIVDEKIDKSHIGFEIGHQFIGHKSCDFCGGSYKLESLISGSAMSRRFGKPPFEIHDKDIWRKMACHLALGLYNITLHWSPEVIVLGGSMFNEVGISIEETEYELKRLIEDIYPSSPLIRRSKLGDFGGLYGSLTLSKSRI